MKKFLSLFLCISILMAGMIMNVSASADSIGEYDIFVSLEGDDSAEGSLANPVATIDRAKELAKNIPESAGNITVWLREGEYSLSSTLEFTETDRQNVTYKAYNGEIVKISGSTTLNTNWKQTTVNSGVKCLVADIGTGFDFTTLFNGDEKLSVTRYPETGYFTVKETCPEDDLWSDENAPWSHTRGQSSFIGQSGEVRVFRNTTDVQIRILHYWHDELAFVKSINTKTGKITMSKPSSMLVEVGQRYFFENVFEALKNPGEWYYEKTGGKLYYVPQEGETADNIKLSYSRVDKLLTMTNCSDIAFEGIIFTDTDWSIPEEKVWYVGTGMDYPQACVSVETAIEADHSENITFMNCEFKNLGGTALKYADGMKDSAIENCYFENINANAIFIDGANGQKGDPNVTSNIKISNNEIYRYGRKFYCAIGILVRFCDGAEISHNEIHDGYYTGISVGWVWGYAYHITNNIKITDNLVYNIGQGWLSDMGGIYTLGCQPGTVISGNVFHNIAADPNEGGYGGWGIYLDEGSSEILVENNLSYACGSDTYHLHYGANNIIRNNIFAFGGDSVIRVNSKDEEHLTATFYGNILLTDNHAPIYSYMQGTVNLSDDGNIMWDISNGSELLFAQDSVGNGTMPMSKALILGYLGSDTVTDPGFADAKNYDFALDENSTAVKLGFKTWDYNNAGTLKGSVIGISKVGGQTKYNDNTSVQEITENQFFLAKLIDLFYKILSFIKNIFKV